MVRASVGLVLVAVVLICKEASAQPKTSGLCPQIEKELTMCTYYDPKVNCYTNKQCKGGQVCCSDGCPYRICTDPDNDEQKPTGPPPGTMIKQCPKPSSSGSFGICSFDESVNCLEDSQCKDGQMCCAEGCNKICKEPVTFQPIKPEQKVPGMQATKAKGQ